jgi:hypothetical protein
LDALGTADEPTDLLLRLDFKLLLHFWSTSFRIRRTRNWN